MPLGVLSVVRPIQLPDVYNSTFLAQSSAFVPSFEFHAENLVAINFDCELRHTRRRCVRLAFQVIIRSRHEHSAYNARALAFGRL